MCKNAPAGASERKRSVSQEQAGARWEQDGGASSSFECEAGMAGALSVSQKVCVGTIKHGRENGELFPPLSACVFGDRMIGSDQMIGSDRIGSDLVVVVVVVVVQEIIRLKGDASS